MKKLLATFTLALAGCFCLPAYASTINIDLNSVYTGATPTGPAPWLQAEFAYNLGDKFGTLTLTSKLSGSDFVQGGKKVNAATGWAFYLDPLLQSAACTGGTNCADQVFIQNYLNSGPTGLGDYNLGFTWSKNGPGGRFAAGDTAIYKLMFADPLSASPFVANGAGFLSTAHIQGIGEAGNSAWITDGGSTPNDVPEPSQLSVLLVGLFALGLMLYARRRAAVASRV
ncbi:PEP-CTERM sorting domain-containing protein [Salinisphaera hydrothermalis]|uniref:PEP-CTERM sorting domain-containing protein n=1 Tax=Salinisphaera hydrothermalis TaxID=563188 RepID=UPI00334052EE